MSVIYTGFSNTGILYRDQRTVACCIGTWASRDRLLRNPLRFPFTGGVGLLWKKMGLISGRFRVDVRQAPRYSLPHHPYPKTRPKDGLIEAAYTAGGIEGGTLEFHDHTPLGRTPKLVP